MKTTHLAQQTLIAILTLLLSGCFWPEKFDATLDIEKDRTFSFVYDGVLAFAPAVAEIKKSGGLSRQDDRKIAEIEGELRKDSGFKAVSYAGDGRFKVRYERTGVIDRTIHIFGDSMRLVTLSPSGDGVAIEGIRLSDRDRQQLQEIGLGFDGTLSVKSGLQVVQDNANSKPTMGFGAHQWKLNWGTQEVPRLITSGLAAAKPIGISPLVLLGIVALLGVIIWRTVASKKKTSDVEQGVPPNA